MGLEHVGEKYDFAAKDRDIEIDSKDPIVQKGFTQVPNFILRSPDLTLGAKITYSIFLSYAWNNDFSFPGQETMAKDIGLTSEKKKRKKKKVTKDTKKKTGVSTRQVRRYIKELQDFGLLTIKRRGLTLTNKYILHVRVPKKKSDDRS